MYVIDCWNSWQMFCFAQPWLKRLWCTLHWNLHLLHWAASYYGWIYILITKNQYVECLVMIAWCFHPNYCYIHFQYVIVQWKIIFQKSKRPPTHLLWSFNSTRIMAGYTFSTPKINMKSDWWWFVGFSSQTIVILTFNMLSLNGKSIFKCLKGFKRIYLWTSKAFELWLDIYFDCQKLRCGVTADGCLVFPATLVLYSLSTCCCLMKNYFSAVKKIANSFTYELQ